jgi:hypothetical protein
MASGVMIYVPSAVKIGSGIQKLIRGIHTQTAWRYHKPSFILDIGGRAIRKEITRKTKT